MPQQKPAPTSRNKAKKQSALHRFFTKAKALSRRKSVRIAGSVVVALSVVTGILSFLGIPTIESLLGLLDPPSCLSSSKGTFTVGAMNSGTAVIVCFQPNSWQARYVIAHYRIDGGIPQDVQMTYNTTNKYWEYPIKEMSPQQTLVYWYTYQKTSDQENGVQYDTERFQWKFP